MGKTYYNISSKKDAAGESEIYMRIYVSKENRIRIATGIWVDAKRWGKKNEINIPNIPGEEQKILLEKKDKLKVLTEYVEKAVQLTEDKSTIDKPYLEKLIRKFHKPSKAKREFEKSFFEVIDTYLAAHKLSENRLKNFRVLIRCLHRFDLYKKKSGGRGFTLSFANLTPELLRQIEDFLLDEKSVFLQYPEIYEQFPYSAKVAVKTPKRKRPPTLDEEGNEVPKGMPQPRGQNTVSDMLTRFRAFILWAIDNGYTANNPF